MFANRPISYATGKMKRGQTYKDFLGELKKVEMQDTFDDFLNECFCKSRDSTLAEINYSPD